jgi:predicted RNA binding protein YcfA (HicA-like mRNA interferase family)
LRLLLRPELCSRTFVPPADSLLNAFLLAQSSIVRILLTLKVREVLKMLRADGWYQLKTRGSHRQVKHPTKPGRVTVAGKPGHDVPLGL